MVVQRFSNGKLYDVNPLNGERTPVSQVKIAHRDVCPLPDVVHALRMRGNHPRQLCNHRHKDGKSAFRRQHFQVQGHPAEGTVCILCRLKIVMYYEEE